MLQSNRHVADRSPAQERLATAFIVGELRQGRTDGLRASLHAEFISSKAVGASSNTRLDVSAALAGKSWPNPTDIRTPLRMDCPWQGLSVMLLQDVCFTREEFAQFMMEPGTAQTNSYEL